jgi:hypothetical protein
MRIPIASRNSTAYLHINPGHRTYWPEYGVNSISLCFSTRFVVGKRKQVKAAGKFITVLHNSENRIFSAPSNRSTLNNFTSILPLEKWGTRLAWECCNKVILFHFHSTKRNSPHSSHYYSSVGIASDYILDGPGSIPGWVKFLFYPQHPDRLWGPPSLLSNG